MIIEKLTQDHRDSIKNLFTEKKFMGVNSEETYFIEADFLETHYAIFCDTYLTDLKNFKAFGSIEDGVVTCVIASYESFDNAEWYGTLMRSNNRVAFKECLDFTLAHYELRQKYKFYTAFNAGWVNSYRRFSFSEYNKERYDYVDEFIVPARTKCIYSMPWQILFNRTLMPVDSIVRCSYLKPKYRFSLPVGGNI